MNKLYPTTQEMKSRTKTMDEQLNWTASCFKFYRCSIFKNEWYEAIKSYMSCTEEEKEHLQIKIRQIEDQLLILHKVINDEFEANADVRNDHRHLFCEDPKALEFMRMRIIEDHSNPHHKESTDNNQEREEPRKRKAPRDDVTMKTKQAKNI